MDHTLVNPVPRTNGEASSNLLQRCALLLSRSWGWIQARKASATKTRRLIVLETVSLGEKRFVAVLQFDKQQFLIGGSNVSVTLLAPLHAPDSFNDVLKKAGAPRKPRPRVGAAA